MARWLTIMVAVAAAASLSACAPPGKRELLAESPKLARLTPTENLLNTLPPPTRKVDIAVYAFPDLTGQHKPNELFTEYSRAVTQGGSAFLVSALEEAGKGSWFQVVERASLPNLLQERQLITATRNEFLGRGNSPLPPLRFAGMILEGGIIGYDANTITGGVGARFLGIGGDVQYRRDNVTVGLRAVSVQTGVVLESVTTTKTVYSVALQASVFKFVTVDKLLESEAGFTRNEPTTLATREGIELAVYALVLEGAEKGLWAFQDEAAGSGLIESYRARSRRDIVASDPSLDDVSNEPVASEKIVRNDAALPSEPHALPSSNSPAVSDAPSGPVVAAEPGGGRTVVADSGRHPNE